ncbi:MAG TPA: glycosyltransferase family 2 protein [Candidatus Sulfomarinibacteraceae bacterium]|nr:glycosyltransferase family 2 protein [Candidatus Sulfomarinibacteraceae bacterium]
MSEPQTCVIILNWRQPQMTVECVHAVQRMTAASFELLLVDNGSGDGSVEYLRRALPDVELLALPENVGFAAGANRALEQAHARGFEHALLMNNDAFPAPDMLSRLLVETAPDVALLSPKIFYEQPPRRIWFAGGRQHPSLLEMRDTGQGEPDGPRWTQSRDVDYLVGTGLLVNLQAAAEVGWLNECFFMYYEDLDWSIRLRQAGYRLRLVADAHLYHRVSRSAGGTDSPLHRYYLARSSILFFRRHAASGRPAAILFYRLGSAIKMVGRLALSGKLNTAWAYVRGLVDGWRVSRNLL